MGLPTTASISVRIEAPALVLYELVSDITKMGRWSPECQGCEWIDEAGRPGSRFRGHNRSGPFRWTTEARVLNADPGHEFSFATLHRGEVATRWIYSFLGDEGNPGATTVTESFEAVRTPRLIAFAERYLIRDRQSQLEDGIQRTLAALKGAAESHPAAGQ